MTDDDTRPVLTPTLERFVREVEAVVGPLDAQRRNSLAKVLRAQRDESYDAGRRGAAQSQQLAAVRPKG